MPFPFDKFQLKWFSGFCREDWNVKKIRQWMPLVSFITSTRIIMIWGLSWSWLYGSWIYNYLCNQCQSPLTLWVRIPLKRGVFDTTCDNVCLWLAVGRWYSPGTSVSSTNKTDHYDITEILLKVTLNTKTLTEKADTMHLQFNMLFKKEYNITEYKSIIYLKK